MSRTDQLCHFVTRELEKASNPEKAEQMQAYLKSKLPMYGVQKAGLEPIYRAIKQRFAPRDQGEYRRNILALWVLPHREEKYAAIAYARQHPDFINSESVPVYERLIREGAWWDLVDGVAIHLIGQVLLAERAVMKPIIGSYVEDSHLWIRRTSLIAHNTHKEATDQAQLFDHCRRLAHEKEFFIRKAIGWALREYSKTAPEAVRDFLHEHRDRLSGLSYREGAKHLVRRGLM